MAVTGLRLELRGELRERSRPPRRRRQRLRAGSAHRRGPSGPTAPTRSAQGRSSSAQEQFSRRPRALPTGLPRSIHLGSARVLLELLDQCDVCNLAASGPTQQQPAPRSADGPGLPRTAVRTLQRRARFCSGTSATSLTRYNVSHLSVPLHRFVRNKAYDRALN